MLNTDMDLAFNSKGPLSPEDPQLDITGAPTNNFPGNGVGEIGQICGPTGLTYDGSVSDLLY